MDRDAVLRQVGLCLAQAHCLTARLYGYLGQHRPVEPQQTWAEAFRIMWNRLIHDVVAVGHYSFVPRDIGGRFLALDMSIVGPGTRWGR